MEKLQASPFSKRFAMLLAAMLTFATLPATDVEAGGRSHKAAKSPSSKIRIQNIRSSSEESPAERDRRLYRECQGRPNSGACAGYTQPRGGRRR